jgi:Transglycosylase SLT domain
MRTTIAFAILLLGLSSAAPEPEYYSLAAAGLGSDRSAAGAPLIEFESSTGRGDRLSIAAPPPREIPAEARGDLQLASADTGIMPAIALSTDATTDGRASLGDLCNALYTSALDNDLPVQFFANLIWQESRLRDDALSKKGAMGIAQFMPKTAVETGLDDPFDPLQAIPASARLLNELHLQFGNLGFVAAAYNAGARRVAQWLEHRGSLPRETRDYVVRVTGLSVDAWRNMPVDGDALTFVGHLPCRSLPAFANVEQEQLEQAQITEAKIQQAGIEELPVASDPAPAARKHDGARGHREPHHAVHERRSAKRKAEHAPHGARKA